MELNPTSAGGRPGGPRSAGGEDEESSQHSNSGSSGSPSTSQEAGSQVPGASTSGSVGIGDKDNYDGSEAEAELELDDDDDRKDPAMEAAMDLMKRMDEGAEASEEEFMNVQSMLFDNANREKIGLGVKKDTFQGFDLHLRDVPMPVQHTWFFDKSIVEWTNLGYLFPQPEAYGGQEQAAYSPTQSTWSYDAPMSPSGHAPPPSPWVYPQPVPGTSAVGTDWPLPQAASPQFSSFAGQPSSSLPPFSTFSQAARVPQTSTFPTSLEQLLSDFPSRAASAFPPPSSTFTGQTSSTGPPSPPIFTDQPASAADRFQPFPGRVPPEIGLSYMYASQASRVANMNADQDTSIVSSILSNVYSRGGVEHSEDTSPRKKFKGHVAKLHEAVGLNYEERLKTDEEWKEIVEQVKERPMNQKSLTENLVDFETLLQLYQLSLLMASYFTVPPQSILEAFEMAYRVRKLGRPGNSQEPSSKDKSCLAKRLSTELMGIVPRYEDFPVPYMAGIEVPEKWFFRRFKHLGGFDRLRYCTSGPFLNWVTPIRYGERQKLRFCYVRPETVAHDYPYDRNRLSSRKDPRVWDLLVHCAGPPFKPLPDRQIFIQMNPAVLRNYMIKLENYIQKIKEIEQHPRKLMKEHFEDRFEVTRDKFNLLLFNHGHDGYNRKCEGVVLREWNRFFLFEREKAFALLQRIADVTQVMMLLMIKYSDGWTFKMMDIVEMLCHRVPLFDPEIVDERPQQDYYQF